MSTPDTSLGLNRIDPDTDQWRDAYNVINNHAERANALFLEDRSRIGALEDSEVRSSLDGALPARGTEAVTVGGIRVVPGVDARYAAFPGVTVLSDGTLFLVWREGRDHVTARDGIIRGALSKDNGLTWGPGFDVLNIPGTDLRDPVLSTSPDRQIMYLAYFKGSAANAAAGFFLRRSTDQGTTFGPEIRIDSHPYAAGCAPLITVGSGLLLATWYGKASTGEARDSVWIATSPDQGTTWSAPVKLVDGVAAGMDMQEPYAASSGDTVVIMYRHGNAANIGLVKSSNGGATWGPAAPAFAGSGRPSVIITSNGTLVCVYRNFPAPASEQHGVLRTSKDLGASWTAPRLVERALAGFWTYSAPLEVSRGQIICPTTVEASVSSSLLSIRYLTEGGGPSPFGDNPQPAAVRVAHRANTVAAADDFDRPDGPLGSTADGLPWASTGGASISGGSLLDTTSNLSAGNFHTLSALTPDVEIEAEFLWSGVSGIYLVFRYQDAQNYLMAGVETGGVNARIYKVVAGTATQIGAAGTVSMPSGRWHKVRLSAIGDNLRLYVEDDLVVSASDATGNTRKIVGLRTGSGIASTAHRVRNFIVRRRSGLLS